MVILTDNVQQSWGPEITAQGRKHGKLNHPNHNPKDGKDGADLIRRQAVAPGELERQLGVLGRVRLPRVVQEHGQRLVRGGVVERQQRVDGEDHQRLRGEDAAVRGLGAAAGRRADGAPVLLLVLQEVDRGLDVAVGLLVVGVRLGS